jgi:lipopolysaccharide/colanic/teichoic acid biosynthesis glycosyltransferase
MLTKTQKCIKRIFDLILVFILLPVLILPIFVLYAIASLSTKQHGFFVQHRVGQYGNLFCCYKLRSLKGENHGDINAMKANETGFGKWLRKSKLDELPQLFNVLKGDMSFVGPRPDVPGYADKLKEEDSVILSIKPGITGPATLKYKNEDELLLKQPNPQIYNDEMIWPDKVAINKEYIKNWSLWKDCVFLFASVIR